ncbi:MAG: RsmE family RNA methyltransferase, partial [Deltaproteobacteria bacterium]
QSRGFDLKLIPTLEGDRVSLKEAFKDISPANVLALIGPEGDFSPAETAAARAAGFLPVSFGANVLRVETAALYVCSILSYVFRG